MVLDGIAQEVDIETGEVLFEWHSLDHVGVEESHYQPSPALKRGFDYFHINSIDLYPDGYLTISARMTSAVYKVDRATGEVVWLLVPGPHSSTTPAATPTTPSRSLITLLHPGTCNRVPSRGRSTKTL